MIKFTLTLLVNGVLGLNHYITGGWACLFIFLFGFRYEPTNPPEPVPFAQIPDKRFLNNLLGILHIPENLHAALEQIPVVQREKFRESVHLPGFAGLGPPGFGAVESLSSSFTIDIDNRIVHPVPG